MKTWIAGFILSISMPASLRADVINVGLASGNSGEIALLPMNFVNTHEIVAMQFDLEFNEAAMTIGSPGVTDDTSTFVAESREVETGRRRVVLFSRDNSSLPNAPILEIPVTLTAPAPAPGLALTITNVIITDRRGRSFVPAVNGGAWEAWLENHFSAIERADPQISGDVADPDGDGMGNFLEFLTATHPRQSESHPTFGIVRETNPTDGKVYERFTFNVAKYLSTEVVSVESTTDLVQWTDTGVILVATGVESGLTREMEAKVEVGNEARRFFRMKGERAPTP